MTSGIFCRSRLLTLRTASGFVDWALYAGLPVNPSWELPGKAAFKAVAREGVVVDKGTKAWAEAAKLTAKTIHFIMVCNNGFLIVTFNPKQDRV